MSILDAPRLKLGPPAPKAREGSQVTLAQRRPGVRHRQRPSLVIISEPSSGKLWRMGCSRSAKQGAVAVKASPHCHPRVVSFEIAAREHNTGPVARSAHRAEIMLAPHCVRLDVSPQASPRHAAASTRTGLIADAAVAATPTGSQIAIIQRRGEATQPVTPSPGAGASMRRGLRLAAPGKPDTVDVHSGRSRS